VAPSTGSTTCQACQATLRAATLSAWRSRAASGRQAMLVERQPCQGWRARQLLHQPVLSAEAGERGIGARGLRRHPRFQGAHLAARGRIRKQAAEPSLTCVGRGELFLGVFLDLEFVQVGQSQALQIPACRFPVAQDVEAAAQRRQPGALLAPQFEFDALQRRLFQARGQGVGAAAQQRQRVAHLRLPLCEALDVGIERAHADVQLLQRRRRHPARVLHRLCAQPGPGRVGTLLRGPQRRQFAGDGAQLLPFVAQPASAHQDQHDTGEQEGIAAQQGEGGRQQMTHVASPARCAAKRDAELYITAGADPGERVRQASVVRASPARPRARGGYRRPWAK
jgi:hypothetical protein